MPAKWFCQPTEVLCSCFKRFLLCLLGVPPVDLGGDATAFMNDAKTFTCITKAFQQKLTTVQIYIKEFK
jgi:hypothetical protein